MARVCNVYVLRMAVPEFLDSVYFVYLSCINRQ